MCYFRAPVYVLGSCRYQAVNTKFVRLCSVNMVGIGAGSLSQLQVVHWYSKLFMLLVWCNLTTDQIPKLLSETGTYECVYYKVTTRTDCEQKI